MRRTNRRVALGALGATGGFLAACAQAPEAQPDERRAAPVIFAEAAPMPAAPAAPEPAPAPVVVEPAPAPRPAVVDLGVQHPPTPPLGHPQPVMSAEVTRGG